MSILDLLLAILTVEVPFKALVVLALSIWAGALIGRAVYIVLDARARRRFYG